jgi:hypothetical protein
MSELKTALLYIFCTFGVIFAAFAGFAIGIRALVFIFKL